MPRHKVQCWVLSKANDDKILCLLLKTNAARGQFSQPVTGSVEKGESFEQGALRELQEETGFSFESAPVYTGYEFEFPSRFGRVTERVFAVWIAAPVDPKLDPKEHDHFEWVLADQAAGRLKYETNKLGLEKALSI